MNVCVCVSVCTRVLMNVCMYCVCECVCVSVCTCVLMNVYMYCVNVSVSVCVCVCLCVSAVLKGWGKTEFIYLGGRIIV